ncbi:unnamed protein product (macronuclear) [Paramecium tetraurelia]|uniref:MHD domain-containing protein n=1 Tax=Paramecium tetraurelia TaxID=5888 RepID=A0BHD1_PARTE|nr:uncharacterized protein GSPATT00028983001 [Paramecium tetraurelia]CAK57948.1 unnamed protein product [Paramecium tetraurelia]|eukprot:XP_001425346.1 hypothetical protein (macronuclear) [Paramecium tetraurelia strain d4-2]
MDESQFNSLQKTIIIPPRKLFQTILQEFETQTPNFQQFINETQSNPSFINGELIPIFIIYESEVDLVHQFQLKKDQQLLRSYPSYHQTNLYVNNTYTETKKQTLEDNKVIHCKILEINVNEEFVDQDLELLIIGTYEQKYCYNGIKTILRNEIPKEQYKQLSYQHSIMVQVHNAFDLEYKYFGNTVKMNIAFQIKSHIQLDNIEMDFLLSESQMIWKDVGINRVVPKCMLQNISINKQYLNNEEGFIEVLLDWPAMLQNEQLQPDLPSRRLSIVQVNPVLEIRTPLYIRWGQQKYTKCNYLLWKIKPIQTIGGEIKEVVRYKDAQNQEYLALKIVLINYSGKEHEIIFCPPSQIFGKKLNQKKDQPLVVLGITLSTEKNLGVLQPNQLCETILRVQLINNGILNMQHINLKIDNQLTELSLNFLYSHQ